MSEQTTDPAPQGQPNGDPGNSEQQPNGGGEEQPNWEELFAGEDPEKIREQLAHARQWEKRAKDNFEKAKQWDALEESKKTPDQKASEALETAQREARESTSKLMRYEVASEAGIAPQDVKWLQGNTKEELEASAEEFLARMGTAAGTQQRGPQPDPTQGRGSSPAHQNANDWMRQQFQS